MAVASSWKTSHREHQTALAALAVTLIAALTLLIIAAIFLFPADPTGVVDPVYVGRIENIPLREPIYYREGGFFVARLSDSEVIAIADRENYPVGCSPDERAMIQPGEKPNTLIWDTSGRFNSLPGVFHSRCRALVYDVTGASIFSTPVFYLKQYRVTVDDGHVTVHPPPTMRRRY